MKERLSVDEARDSLALLDSLAHRSGSDGDGEGGKVLKEYEEEADFRRKLKDRDAEKDRLLSDYSYFYQEAWKQVDDNYLIFSWHQQLMCDYLQGLNEGVALRDLIINLPQGCGKSINSSVIWPAWCWARNPNERIMACSYDEDLVKKQAIDCKKLIQSEWYRLLRGICPDQPQGGHPEVL